MAIYILSVGMSEAYLERLAGIAGKFCRSLHVAELGNLRERFDYAVDTRGFDISAMGAPLCPQGAAGQSKKGPCIWTAIPL